MIYPRFFERGDKSQIDHCGRHHQIILEFSLLFQQFGNGKNHMVARERVSVFINSNHSISITVKSQSQAGFFLRQLFGSILWDIEIRNCR